MLASESQSGLVSTGSQTFSGNKFFNNPSTTLALTMQSGGKNKIRFLAGTGSEPQLNILEFSHNSLSGEPLSYYENYKLPSVDLDRTSNGSYMILTDKPGQIVPIKNGGTGASTAADAWAALGGGSIGKKSSLAASDITSGTLGIERGGTGADGTTTQTLTTGLVLRSWGKVHCLVFASLAVSSSAIGTIPSGYRPSSIIYGICRYVLDGTYYPALIQITSAGAITAYYFNGSNNTAISSGTLNGSITWVQG